MAAAREAIEVEALVTDLYLESLLASRGAGTVAAAAFGWADGDLDRGVRLASLRLRRDLPRFHPSFRFEERLALRLAEASAAMRVARAAGAEGGPIPVSRGSTAGRAIDEHELAALVGMDGQDPGLRRRTRPLLIGGAVASAAISLAGAAFVAWRRSHAGGSAMARAVRAAHAARAAAGRPAGEQAD
jgi:hypothetical protein